MTEAKNPAVRTLARTSGLAATVAVVGLTLTACGSDSDKSDAAKDTPAQNTTAQNTTGETPATGTTEAPVGDTTYKNGEYSATGEYVSPGGPQKVGVTVTLNNDVITALELDTSYAKSTSAQFQGKFASGIDEIVVGKNIDDLDVSKVAGSSLTSGGFNEAIDTIKAEAKN